MTHIGGSVDPAFAAVADAFTDNFRLHDERGAAVCVVVDGRVVADLWGGAANEHGGRWEGDTLVNAFSVGKGLLALLAARLAGEGRLRLDDPIAAVWPEFAAAGKAEITPRQLLAHRAGLPAVRRRLPPNAMTDWTVMTEALAAQAPWWTPGEAHGYHTNTFGFLVGEVVRRITGRSPGAMLRELVAQPLGADVHLGLPASHDARTATFAWSGDTPAEEAPEDLSDTDLMRYNTYFNPAGLSGAGIVNTRAWRGAEIPSANVHASARGVARVYAALAAGGVLGDTRIVDRGALADAVVEHSAGDDLILGRPSRFGLGFQLTQPERPLGPGPMAFGHFGAGGSVGFCDPERGVAVGYVMNTFGPRWRNPRNTALIEATFASVEAMP